MNLFFILLLIINSLDINLDRKMLSRLAFDVDVYRNVDKCFVIIFERIFAPGNGCRTLKSDGRFSEA